MDTFGPVSRQRPGHRRDVRRRRRARARRSSPSSTPSATPPRRSPRASRSPPPCSPRPRCSARTRDAIGTRAGRRRRRGRRPAPAFTFDGRLSPNTLVGLIIGAAVVFLFSGLAINAVVPRGRRGRLRGAPPVPRAPRDHGLHREARVRPRRRHLHPDSLRELATPGLLAVLRADRGRLRPRRRPAGRLPGRRDRAPAR